jgi:serine/threonine protein kinase
MTVRWYKGVVSASIHALPVTIGALTLIDRLGAGGMAEVFLATRPGSRGSGVEQVVVKRMLPHLAAQERYRQLFRREAAIGARIHDRHVVHTHGLVEDGDSMMLVVEYIDGATLRSLARIAYEAQIALPLPLVLRLFAHAARGLSAIHGTTDERGRPFVHRDISPDNLMVGRDGITRVLDFGVARPGGEGVLTRTGEIRGKLPYMPPEQLDARTLDGRSDLYALGVSLFWMLTGRRPFVHRSEVELIRAIMQDRPPRVRSVVPDIPVELDTLIDALLEKDPARRPVDAATVARRLEDMGASPEADVGASVAELLVLEAAPPDVRRAKSTAATAAPLPQTVASRPKALGLSPLLSLASATGQAAPMVPAPTLSAASEWGGQVSDDDDPPPALMTATSATRAPTTPLPGPRRTGLVALAAGAASAVVVAGAWSLSTTSRPAVPAPAAATVMTPAGPAPDGPGTATASAAAPPSAAPLAPVAPVEAVEAAEAAEADDAAESPQPHEPVRPTTTAPPTPTPTMPPAPDVRPSARAGFVVVVRGAPEATVWRVGNREVGRGDGPLSLPAGTRRVEAAFDGARVVVPLEGDEIDWDALPRGVLSVRAHGGTIRVGATAWEVPAKVRLVAGRYVVRYSDDDGRTSEHRIDVRSGATAVLNVAESP